MKVFLSWSGVRSHEVAKVFNDWLPSVIQQLNPWLSSEHIEKGQAWLQEIKEAIAASNGVGIFFLTADALNSSWVLFEAGGVAALEKQRVCTVVVDPEVKIGPPLSFFQSTKLDRADLFKLIKTINARLPAPLADGFLEKSFDRVWPELEASLAKALKVATAEKPPVPSRDHQVEQALSALAKGVQGIEARLGRLEEESQKNNAQLVHNVVLLGFQVNQLLQRPVAIPPTDFGIGAPLSSLAGGGPYQPGFTASVVGAAPFSLGGGAPPAPYFRVSTPENAAGSFKIVAPAVATTVAAPTTPKPPEPPKPAK